MGTTTLTLHTEAEGMVPRALKQIFSTIDDDPANEYKVYCSFVEIYNEEFMDLLSDVRAVTKEVKEIQIREDSDYRIVITGLSELRIECVEDALELLERGNAIRRTAGTLLNEVSSRSHAIFTINLEKYSPVGDGVEDEGKFVFAKLHLVDLAGDRISFRFACQMWCCRFGAEQEVRSCGSAAQGVRRHQPGPHVAWESYSRPNCRPA